MAERLTITGFKFGLDTRRSELTSVPGTLVTCENGHINQGAEVEKRKAFTILDHNLPRAVALSGAATNQTATLNAYGLQETPSSGLYTFGNANAALNTVATGVPYVFPTGVTYQRLRHYLWWLSTQTVPTTAGSTATVDVSAISEPVMDKVVMSCSYAGLPVVIAHFAAGGSGTLATTILFYNGTPIVAQEAGVEWYNPSGNARALAIQLCQELNAWFADGTFTSAFAADTTNSVFLANPGNESYTVTVSDTSSGKFTIGTKTAPTSPSDAVASSVQFAIKTGIAGDNITITAPDGNGGAGTVTLCNFNQVGTNPGIGTQVKNAINASGTGYICDIVVSHFSQGVIRISAPTTFQASKVNGKVVSVAFTNTNFTHIQVGATEATLSSTTPQPFSMTGGSDASTGAGATQVLQFGSADWTVGQHYTLTLSVNNIDYAFGYGNIGGTTPTFVTALGGKLYFSASATFYFSSVDDATKFEQQDTGAGFVPVSDQALAPTDVVALASYQGRLGVFARRNVQIWHIESNPANYQMVQSLQNIGTMAPLSVWSIGDLDVLFLSDTGVRSLRVRDSSLNAYVVDIGSPIDSPIVTSLLAAGDNALACGIVEPTSNRYWLHLKGTIYVLSYFPSLKISAWSTYLPTYQATSYFNRFTNVNVVLSMYLWVSASPDPTTASALGAIAPLGHIDSVDPAKPYFWFGLTNNINDAVNDGSYDRLPLGFSGEVTINAPFVAINYNYNQTTFVPEKFLVYQGQVYCLDTSGKIFRYGGTDNNTYDGVVLTVECPWLDAKVPHLQKAGERLDMALAGWWQIECGMDPKGTTNTVVVFPYPTTAPTVPDEPTDSTFDNGQYPLSGLRGTHLKFLAYTNPAWTKIASLSSATFQYNKAEEA